MGKHARKPTVIVMSSHVIRGSVGNRAAVFALETLGFPVWAIPTIILPWHPGHGSATRMVADKKSFEAMLSDLGNARWIGEVGAILTGYMANSDQVKHAAGFIQALRERSPGICYVCDPVIGDGEGLYVSQETAEAIRDCFLPLADLATPNRFELAWLSGEQMCTTTSQAVAQARILGSKRVLVTSAPAEGGQTSNLLVSAPGQSMFKVSHPEFADPPNGPGDLTAAIMLAHLLDQHREDEALALTTASVSAVLERSLVRGEDELALETHAKFLLEPEILDFTVQKLI